MLVMPDGSLLVSDEGASVGGEAKSIAPDAIVGGAPLSL